MNSDNVAVSVDQFYTIRDAIRASIQIDQNDNSAVASDDDDAVDHHVGDGHR